MRVKMFMDRINEAPKVETNVNKWIEDVEEKGFEIANVSVTNGEHKMIVCVSYKKKTSRKKA